MAAVLFHEPIFATEVASGDQLYFYETGTSTTLTVYSDAALSASLSQPVTADSAGRFPAIYFDPTAANPKVVLKDSSDVEKWTVNEYPIEDTASISQDLSQAQTDITAVEGRMTTAESDIDTLQADVSTLQTESTDYDSRITTLEGATAPTGPVAAGFFSGGDSPTYKQSMGVTGTVNRTAAGSYTITFSTARANANYIVTATAGSSPVSSPLECVVTSKTTNSFVIETWYTTGGSTRDKTDRDVNFIVFDLDA